MLLGGLNEIRSFRRIRCLARDQNLPAGRNHEVILEEPGGGGGGTWVKFCWVCAAGISEPLPHYSLFLVHFVAKYRPHLSHFWANGFLTLKVPKKCDPTLVTLMKMLEKPTQLYSVES